MTAPSVWEANSTHPPVSTRALKEKFWFVVYRAYGAGSLTELKSVESTARAFNDADLVGNGKYQYAVRVQTTNGGLSPVSQPVTVEVR